MNKTKYVPDQFCWVDHRTTDTDKAKEFYSRLLKWSYRDMPTEQGVCTMFMKNGSPTAGMARQPPVLKHSGAPPLWSSYVCVDDARATPAEAQPFHAKVAMPVAERMNQGWLAFMQDPRAGAFDLWQPGENIGAAWASAAGGFCWNELYTHDIEGAKSFYEKLFGWEFHRSRTGGREYWTIKNVNVPNGGMMKIRREWGDMPPSWSVYFRVESCRDSLAEGESLGAKVFIAPMAVPQVGILAGLQDPQGAHFLIIEMSEQL